MIMSSLNRENFTFSHLCCIHYILFSSLIALVITSSCILSESGENRYTCDLRDKAFNLSLLSVTYVAFIKFQYIPHIPSFLRIWMDVVFGQRHFLQLWDIIIFIFYFINKGYHIYWLAYIKPNFCIVGINPSWPWYVIFLICCWKLC